jgi:hypothetical protein
VADSKTKADPGTVKIDWVFHRDISKQGTSEYIPVDDARELVRTGRARYANVTAERQATAPVAPTTP